jgi:hypothetical protein
MEIIRWRIGQSDKVITDVIIRVTLFVLLRSAASFICNPVET